MWYKFSFFSPLPGIFAVKISLDISLQKKKKRKKRNWLLSDLVPSVANIL